MSEAPPVLLQAQGLRICRDSARETDLDVLGGSAVVLAGDSRPFLELLAAVLAGSEKPWSGRITAGRAGVPVLDRAARSAIGFLSSAARCPRGMTPRSYLGLLAAAMGLGMRQGREAVSEVLRWCSLTDVRRVPSSRLTEEQHRQVAFAAAVLPNPSLFIAQVPLPAVLYRQLEDLKAIGKAIVLTADCLGSIPPCADRVVLCSGTDMVKTISRNDLAKVCSAGVDIHVSFCPALPRTAIEEMPGLSNLVSTDDGYSFSHPSPAAAAASVTALARANSRALTALDMRSPSISALLAEIPDEQPGGKDQDLFWPQEQA